MPVGTGTISTAKLQQAWITLSVAGSANVTLTTTQAENQFIELTGALTGNIIVIIPNTIRLNPATGCEWTFANLTSGAFTLSLQFQGQAGSLLIQQGAVLQVYYDGTILQRIQPEIDRAGHWIGSGVAVSPATTVAAGVTTGQVTAGAVGQIGTGGTVQVTGNDTNGVITVATGTGVPTAGLLLTVTFGTAYGVAPKVGFQAGNLLAAGITTFRTSTGTNFSLSGGTALAASTTYVWDYFIER